MKTPRKSVAWLLPMLMLTGCFHKTQQAQNQPLAPAVVDTPPPKPQPSPTDLPPPVVTVPPSQPAATVTPPPKPVEKPVKHAARHPKSENKPTEQASSGSPEVPAIGQLSPGDPSELRSGTEDSLASIERGLKDINRTLTDQEQKTVAQIKEFLKQARTALASGDVDGAHTLALKAKVLLGEISQ
jgi:outer membrane biosynthesis protein TonB